MWSLDVPRPGSAWAAFDIALAWHRRGLGVAGLGPEGIATRAPFDLDRMAFLGGAQLSTFPQPLCAIGLP